MAVFDNFNSYSVGDLNGQGSWSGATAFKVEVGTVQEGANAISITTSDGNIDKSFVSTVTDGVFSGYLRTGANGADSIQLRLCEGSTLIALMYFDTSGLAIHDGDGNFTYGSLSINTWYKCQMQWRSSDKKFRYQVDNAGWSNWFATGTSFTTGINKARISNFGATTHYIDTLELTDSTPSPDEQIQIGMTDSKTLMNMNCAYSGQFIAMVDSPTTMSFKTPPIVAFDLQCTPETMAATINVPNVAAIAMVDSPTVMKATLLNGNSTSFKMVDSPTVMNMQAGALFGLVSSKETMSFNLHNHSLNKIAMIDSAMTMAMACNNIPKTTFNMTCANEIMDMQGIVGESCNFDLLLQAEIMGMTFSNGVDCRCSLICAPETMKMSAYPTPISHLAMTCNPETMHMRTVRTI